MTNIPDWLQSNENYSPKKDSTTFIDRSSSSLVSLLSSFKRNNNIRAREVNTSLRLFAMLVYIILTSVSRNFSFVILMLSAVIVRLAFLKGDQLRSWLKAILPVLLLSLLILIPSVFIGNPKTPLTILGKIFVSVSLVLIVNMTSSFNNITRSLKRFRVPDVVIFTFDLTIKYIMILGDVCANMLLALKIRSIGKNKDKRSSASGVLGTVFIKAKASADATMQAMECRGFSGEYVSRREKFKLTKFDFINIAALFGAVLSFVYLEVLI